MMEPRRYEGRRLDKIAFPVGGMGAGMFCLDGTGAFSHFSLRHLPEYFNEGFAFSALAVRDGEQVTARVLEGPVPPWKPLFPWDRRWASSGHGAGGMSFGLPRFAAARFSARFPFATVALDDPAVPVETSLTAWSPFVPGDADASGLPVGTVEYRFRNPLPRPVELAYSFHSRNFLRRSDPKKSSVGAVENGFAVRCGAGDGAPADEAAFAAWIDDRATQVDLAWFRGDWFDGLTMAWKNIASGKAVANPPHADDRPGDGASLYFPLTLAAGEERVVRLHLAWYAPYSTIREGHPDLPPGEKPDPKTGFYRPWYAARFDGVEAVAAHWTKENARLRAETARFADAFYDTTLPPEVVDAVAANLTILKTPTVLRERGGTLWAWEGTGDEMGSCSGTCTHVWNYAQALPHLFPALERGLRETEFLLSQDGRGHQDFRSALPPGPTRHAFHAAADGQLGGIVKAYRDWRISGDDAWLRTLWPSIRRSLDYCIGTWDPDHRGAPVEPHHNTYDIEFWGPDGLCTSFYLAALCAALEMARALGDAETALYARLADAARDRLEGELFNGEYFAQKIVWKGLRSPDPVEMAKAGVKMDYSPEAKALLEREGPKYQYGDGCLADGVLGTWMAWAAGLGAVADPAKIGSHLAAVHRHNFRRDLSAHPNPQRSGYGFGGEAGLLLCTWPRGGALTLPFVYSEEVWTGIEYQVAAHLVSLGRVEAGLEIVRAARARYDGAARNPFGEIECGHWYARAMSSYALLQAFSGARYDAVERKLHLAPRIAGDFRSFLAVDGGYGTVGVRGGQPFLDVRAGAIEVREIAYTPAAQSK